MTASRKWTLPPVARGLYRGLMRALWYALLVSIPVTSFPWISERIGGSVVSPLAGLPLVGLTAFYLVPKLIQGRDQSSRSLPLLVFVLAAVLSTALAAFLTLLPFLNQDPPGRGLRALVTLGAGLCFYLVSVEFPQTHSELRRSLRWLYAGCALALLWSSVQTYSLFLNIFRDVERTYISSGWMNRIHRFFSIRDLFARRITGLAYEPSWLADQLVILYLPLLLASVLKAYSVFTRRKTRFSVELLLLVWTLPILFLSQSRIGYLSFFAAIAVLALHRSWRSADSLIGRFPSRRSDRSQRVGTASTRARFAVVVGLAVLVAGTLFLVLFLAAQVDARIARMFETDFVHVLTTYDQPVYALASKLKFAERFVYWHIGLRTFSMYPMFGVGLGNAGFLFREALPDFGTRLPEILDVLKGSAGFPNPKSLWVRLLAETGIVGFLLFAAWLLTVLRQCLLAQKAESHQTAVIGLAGGLALIAFFFEGFSLDTFALPQAWIMFGLVAAAVSSRFDSAG